MMKNETNSFSELYESQINFQLSLFSQFNSNSILPPDFSDKQVEYLPIDNIEWFKYHCLSMVEELGEVLQSDKRWKIHRNQKYIKGEKLDELADIFLTFCNMAIYSGFSSQELYKSILNKVQMNHKRIKRNFENE